MPKVIGFFLNFGFAESSKVAQIHMRHMDGYFPSLKEAAQNLAHYFLDDYLDTELEPTLDKFTRYLYDLPECVASGGIGTYSFMPSCVNDERWWAWDQMSEIYELMDMFYEIRESAENVLVRFLDPKKIKDRKFKKEIKEAQTLPKDADEWDKKLWVRDNSDEIFIPVVKKE